jgi:KipI family sensor histidine kinase inhibitor
VTGAELHDVGVGATVVEYPGRSDEEANRRAVALGRALLDGAAAGIRDAIPGARTLLLRFDPAVLSHAGARALLSSTEAAGPDPAAERGLVAIPVCYGGEQGPDLPELSARAGLTGDELARRHAAGEYRVAFLGFAPGFAYLTGLDPALAAPRLPTPRPRVPAGSVAIGGPYTGVYPSATPGGWRLIGRSPIRLFDEEADPPALLSPGHRVRFEPIGKERLAALDRELLAAEARTDTSPGGRPVFRIVKPGVFTSVQSAPRWRRGAAGLPEGGAMDESALAAGNARLGNAAAAPAIEMTLLGPELEALSAVGVCLSGDGIAADRDGQTMAPGAAATLSAGDRLRFGPARGGARAYLCVEGGLLLPGRLGLTRRLEAGAILMAPAVAASCRVDSPSAAPPAADRREAPAGDVTLRVLLDPRRDRFFDAAAVAAFLASSCRVSAVSDRRGIRLEGPAVAALGTSETPPEAAPLGAIQVPPDGQPILLGPDRPVTGGYARIGTIVAADWPAAAQALPGRSVRFRAVTLEEALGAGAEARSRL